MSTAVFTFVVVVSVLSAIVVLVDERPHQPTMTAVSTPGMTSPPGTGSEISAVWREI